MDKKAESTRKLLFTLFLSTFRLSAFTFGGGYVIVPLMRKRFVEDLQWIEEEEMLDIIALAQSAPGVIAVNTSLMVGYHLAGIKGALVSALGTVSPPLILISILSLFYDAFRDNEYVSAAMRGMQAGVAAIICSVVIDMGTKVVKSGKWFAAIIMAIVFCAIYFFRVNVAWVMLACALAGLARWYFYRQKTKSSGRQDP